MNDITDNLCKHTIKNQIDKISSPDCGADTLLQSYHMLARLAYIHKNDKELLDYIFSALDICLKNPKNNDVTYENAIYSMALSHANSEPKLMFYTANAYKKISQYYGGSPLIANLDDFYAHNSKAAPIVLDCVKNIYENKLAPSGNADISMELLRNVHDSSPHKLKSLEAIQAIVENSSEDKGKLSYAYYTLSNMNFDTAEEAKKTIEIVKKGMSNPYEKSDIRNRQFQILDKVLDKYPNMAKDVLDILKPKLNKEESNYNFASSINLTSDLLSKIGTVDSSLATEVTNIENKIHPNHQKFRFYDVNGKKLLSRFSYYDDGSLRYESNWKGNKLQGKTTLMSKEGTTILRENYNNGVKDGLEVRYGKNNNVIGLLVYNEGNLTNAGIGTDGMLKGYPINQLSNGTFVQKFDNGYTCFYPSGDSISIDKKNKTIALTEKKGTIHQFSGQTVSDVIKHTTSIDNIEDKVIELQKSCKERLQSENRIRENMIKSK